MNVYVESNFVLELTLAQEESDSCEQILLMGEAGNFQLFLPAFSLAEPYETLIRRDKDRKEIARELQQELTQMRRSVPRQTKVEAVREVIGLLTLSGSEDMDQLAHTSEAILSAASVIPLNSEVLLSALTYQNRLGLSPQDAIVYASVLWHLQETKPDQSCFINRNAKDFDDPDVKNSMGNYGCTMLFSFNAGYDYIHSQIE